MEKGASVLCNFHRIIECLVLEGTSVGHPVQPPAQAGSPREGGTAPHPGGSGISPEKETPQPPWAACSFFPWSKWVWDLQHPTVPCPGRRCTSAALREQGLEGPWDHAGNRKLSHPVHLLCLEKNACVLLTPVPFSGRFSHKKTRIHLKKKIPSENKHTRLRLT